MVTVRRRRRWRRRLYDLLLCGLRQQARLLQRQGPRSQGCGQGGGEGDSSCHWSAPMSRRATFNGSMVMGGWMAIGGMTTSAGGPMATRAMSSSGGGSPLAMGVLASAAADTKTCRSRACARSRRSVAVSLAENTTRVNRGGPGGLAAAGGRLRTSRGSVVGAVGNAGPVAGLRSAAEPSPRGRAAVSVDGDVVSSARALAASGGPLADASAAVGPVAVSGSPVGAGERLETGRPARRGAASDDGGATSLTSAIPPDCVSSVTWAQAGALLTRCQAGLGDPLAPSGRDATRGFTTGRHSRRLSTVDVPQPRGR